MTNRSSLFSSAARTAWLIFSLVLSVMAAWLIARDVQWTAVARSIVRANAGWLLAALASFVLTLVLKALRWRALFVPRPRGVSVWDLFAAMVFGQMFNMSLPMRAGDVSRAAIIGRPGLSRMTVLATVAAEKWVDIVAALALALGLLPFMAWPDWARSPLDVTGAVVLMGILGLVGVAIFRRPISALVQRVEQAGLPSLVARIMQWMRRAWQGMAALRTPGAALGVAGWTILIWALGASTNWLAGQALDLHGTAVMWGFLLLVLQVGVAAPSTPGRIFVFEALAMGALSPFGVRGDLALAYAVILHVIVIVPITLGGLALWPFIARAGDAHLRAEVES